MFGIFILNRMVFLYSCTANRFGGFVTTTMTRTLHHHRHRNVPVRVTNRVVPPPHGNPSAGWHPCMRGVDRNGKSR
jgi:hypothetical protein